MECFTVYVKNIEKRLDPLYLKNISYIKNFKTKYPLVALGNLLKENPQYGANEPAIEGNPKADIRYIRITDIDEFGNLKADDWKTAKTINKRYLLNENDILFARSGATAGKTFIYKKDFGKAIYAGYLIRFKFDETKVNPSFVFFYMHLQKYSLWVKSIQRPSGQPNINSEEFKAFEIPLPPLEIQNRIVSIMQSAYKQKKQKEQEAEKLLNSIDDYVLNELGIKLPEFRDKQCYAVDVKEINERLDPYYYQPRFYQTEETLKEGNYKLVSLKESFNAGLIKGILPNQDEKIGNVKVLQIRNIKVNGLTDISEYLTAKNIFSEEHKLKYGDILIVITGATIGKVGLWLLETNDFYLGGDIVKFQPNNNFNSYYIQSFLLSKFGQLQIKRYITGATNKHLSPHDVERIKIPCPPLALQQKIAEEVKKRMNEAEKLKTKANSVVEKAKQKVEEIILGK